MRIAALVLTASGALAAQALGAPQASGAHPSSAFGSSHFEHVRAGGETNLTGGTMRRVACADGARPGARCYVAR